MRGNRQKNGFSRKNKPRLAFLAASLLFALAACGTTPPALPPVHPAAALPPDMDAYFYLSVAENTELLRGFAEADGNSTMGSRYFLEHSRSIYGAVSKTRGDAGFLIAAAGDYSVGLVEFGIGTDGAWEETSVLLDGGEARYYRNKETGMEIAIPSPQLILMGSGVAERLAWLYAGVSPPLGEDTLGDLESHAAGFYLPRAGKTGLPPFIPAGSPIPLKEATLFADPSGRDGLYAASGRLLFADGKNATGAAIMLRFAFSGLMAQQGYSLAEIRQSLKVAVEARSIVFSGLSFPEEMARMMLFSLMAGDGNS
ncbi:MAG: hypothetical protein LBT33_00100 [Spirochaetia bacterium]|jgi:hypothetical protein|nr:hypothetical protein [Spirochaetia bacterium]